MSDSAIKLFNQGELGDALARATEGVKARPSDVEGRWLLAELLCFTGELGRADVQLDTIAQQDGKTAVGVGLFRKLIRADEARTQFYAAGRVPEIVETVGEEMRLRLEASVLLREEKEDKAAEVLGESEKQRVHARGECDGAGFEDFRDLDDLVGGMLEVFAGDGKFYWIAWSSVESIEFEKPQRPRDLLWRKAKLSVLSGPGGEVHVPALYVNSHQAADSALKLGRGTSWSEGKIVRGAGQRMFMVGEETKGVMEIGRLQFQRGG